MKPNPAFFVHDVAPAAHAAQDPVSMIGGKAAFWIHLLAWALCQTPPGPFGTGDSKLRRRHAPLPSVGRRSPGVLFAGW